jgi:hypothetical protein
MNEEVEKTWANAKQEVEGLLHQSESVVMQGRINELEHAANSIRESRELFEEFVNNNLSTLHNTLAKNKSSHSVLLKLEPSLDAINKQIKTIYNPAVMEKFLRESNTALEATVSQ